MKWSDSDLFKGLALSQSAKTKIIATVGPSVSEESLIEVLVEEGISGFRINFSHGDPPQWKSFLEMIRRAERKLGRWLAIIGDLQGPSLRIGHLPQGALRVLKGEKYIFELAESAASENTIPVPLGEFFSTLEPGDVVYLGDSMLPFRVAEVSDSKALSVALENGEVRSKMAAMVKGKEVGIPYITPKDERDLLFAVENGFSHVMVSFVRAPGDVRAVRKKLQDITSDPPLLLAKIETDSAVKELSGILRESDGVVVARGDLGKVYPLEELPELQEYVVSEARSAGKPVYVATQLLASMVGSPAPSRSDVTDVYTSVREGVDGVVLTNETSIGKYPVESVRWAKRIILKAESRGTARRLPSSEEISWRFGQGLVELADLLDARILLFSLTGRAMRITSAFRPHREFYLGSPNERVLRDCSALYACVPFKVTTESYEEGLEDLKLMLKERGLLREGELAVSSYKFSNLDKQKIVIEKI